VGITKSRVNTMNNFKREHLKPFETSCGFKNFFKGNRNIAISLIAILNFLL
jgi:hypothetical protein